MDDFEHIDDLFRDSIEPLNETPMPVVWDKLKSQLDAVDARVYKKKYIAVRRVSLSLTAIILLLVTYQTGIFRNHKTSLAQDISESAENKNIKPLQFQHHNSSNKIHPREDSKPAPSNIYLLSENGNTHRTTTSIDKIDVTVDRSSDLNSFSGSVNENEITESKVYTPVIVNAIILKNEVSENRIIKNPLPLKVSLSTTNVTKQNGKPFSHDLNFTFFGSAVWAKYNLENNFPDQTVSPNTIQNSLQANFQHDNKSIIEQRETPELSYNAGILASYSITKHWGIQSGIFYNSSYIAIAPQKIYAVEDAGGEIGYKFVTSSGYGFIKPNFSSSPALGDSVLSTTANHILQYLSFPILLKYNMVFNRFEISPGIGASANILTSTSIQTELEIGRKKETVFISSLQGTKSIFISLNATTEIKYRINNNWALDFMPAFSYAVSPVTQNSVVKTFPYSLSMGFGLNYKFY